MSIELVVFDIAGTTVADKGNINDVFRKAFLNAGIENVDAADVDEVMGYRKKEAIEIIVAKYKPGYENDDAFIDAIHEDFTNQMVSYYETCDGLVPLPFAEKVFRELHNQQSESGTQYRVYKSYNHAYFKKAWLGYSAYS